MISIKKGNILDCTEDIIVHQVNVQGIMGRRSSKATCRPIPWIRKRIL